MARKRLTGNKQRLVELKERERLAAVTGGAIDESIPLEAWETALREERGCQFDLARIVEQSKSAIGYCRGFHNPGQRGALVPEHLKPSEIRDQAAATADMIDALILRMDNLHPDLHALADEALWPARRETLQDVSARLKPDLYRLRAAIVQARSQIPEGKTGGKANEWTTARTRLVEALQEHSEPRIGEGRAKAVATVLLEACGLPNPRKPRSP